jgi:acetyl esterase/lipase
VTCASPSQTPKLTSLAEDVTSQDVSIPTSDGHSVEARIYHSKKHPGDKLPLYIYLHGGGFHFGNLESEDMHCRLIASNVGAVVLSVNYRHTPKWTFPTPVHDVWDALDWIAPKGSEYGFDPAKTYAGGVSAGGGLSIALALHELEEGRGTSRIKGLVLTIPPTCDETVFPRHLVKDGYTSFEQNANAPLLPMARVAMFHGMYKADPKSPYSSPLLVEDAKLKGFPPTAFHVCGADPLRDGGLLFEEKLRSAGIKTRMEIYLGFPHAFMNFPTLVESKKWREKLFEDIRWVIGA